MAEKDDLCVEAGDYVLNVRVGAIIIHDNKLLMMKATAPRLTYYSVGGRIKFGEDSEQAIVREIYEETGIHGRIDRLGFVLEKFFCDPLLHGGRQYHEFGYYYYISNGDAFVNAVSDSKNESNASEKLVWIDMDNIPEENFYPEIFYTELKNPSQEIRHFIIREN